jgi:ABC-type lipoprotein export system ATPase subunit
LETADERSLRAATQEPPVVEATDLRKRYEGDGSTVTVLSGVDLVVRRAEIVALSGPSGSGKSTLLNVLGCLDRPTSGTYRLCGVDVSRLSREEQAFVRLHTIGFIFQAFHLLSHATALENAALPLGYAGKSREASERAASELLTRVGLGARLGHFPSQLSGGEKQRVAIARALIASPRLLLADEPTGALDSKTGHEIMKLLLELHAERQTSIVLVTHDPKIADYADRRVALLDGRIVGERQRGRAISA